MTATVATAAAAEHSVSRSEDYDSLPSFLPFSLLVYFGISARPTEQNTWQSYPCEGKSVRSPRSLARHSARRPSAYFRYLGNPERLRDIRFRLRDSQMKF